MMHKSASPSIHASPRPSSLLLDGYIPKRRRSVVSFQGMVGLLLQVERKLNVKKLFFTILALLIVVPFVMLLFAAFIVLKLYRACKKMWILYKATYSWEVLDISTDTIMSWNCERNNTLIFVASLEGIVNFTTVKEEIQNYINSCGEVSNSKQKLRHILCNINGLYAWRPQEKFCLSNHVTMGLPHHHGNSLCQRNIQEYISDLCSESLSQDLPPWQVVVTYGWGEHDEQMSWVICRGHRLLVRDLALKDISSTFPNPWASTTETRPLNILSAPSVLLQLINVSRHSLIEFIIDTFYFIYVRLKDIVIGMTQPKIVVEWLTIALDIYLKTVTRFLNAFRYLLLLLNTRPSARSLVQLIIIDLTACIVVLAVGAYYLPNIVIHLIKVTLKCIGIKKSDLCLLEDAMIEMYWIFRAVISIPRLLVTELYENHTAPPIHTWGEKQENFWKRNIVSWSDDIPLSSAKEMRAATGACVPSVVLAALGGGIRDMVRSNGVTPLTRIRCTFPVYIPNRSQMYGLLPFALPTSASSGHVALQQSFNSMEDLRKYPERYLASVWLRKCLPHFVPVGVFKRIENHLTATHPILLTYLIGPDSPSYLWGRPMKNCFLWRPPQQNAVVSVCVTSYCDRISTGVMANGWSVPQGRSLPRLFYLHFTEILHEHGILIERKRSGRSRSRGKNDSSDMSSPNESLETSKRRVCVPKILVRRKSYTKIQGVLRTTTEGLKT